MNEWVNMPTNKIFKENEVVEGLYLDHGATNFLFVPGLLFLMI